MGFSASGRGFWSLGSCAVVDKSRPFGSAFSPVEWTLRVSTARALNLCSGGTCSCNSWHVYSCVSVYLCTHILMCLYGSRVCAVSFSLVLVGYGLFMGETWALNSSSNSKSLTLMRGPGQA